MRCCWCGERFFTRRTMKTHLEQNPGPEHFECTHRDLNAIGYRALRTGRTCAEVRKEMLQEREET